MRGLKGKMKKPTGRIPKIIKAHLKLYEKDGGDTYWRLCVCTCGRWFTKLDRLWPYHTETNWCRSCESNPDAETENNKD